jgi:DNA polymerase III alpha subunit
MTFENRIKEERSVIGMSISGNPLDGLDRYIIKKSIGLNYVKEFLDELNSIDTEDPLMAEEIGEISTEISLPSEGAESLVENQDIPPKKDQKQKPIVQIIGYVDSIRKIQTKKGDNMLIVACSAIDWKFTTVVFPKFY